MTRAQEVTKARALRASGLTYGQIAGELGVTRRRAQHLCHVSGPTAKDCKQCGSAFEPTQGKEIYCSPNCRSKSDNARKRRCAKSTGRTKCIDCGEVLCEGSRWRGHQRCRECFKAQIDTQRDEKAAEVERLWAAGKSVSEIAEVLGYTVGSMAVQITRLRRMGYSLPYRRSTGRKFPEQVAA